MGRGGGRYELRLNDRSVSVILFPYRISVGSGVLVNGERTAFIQRFSEASGHSKRIPVSPHIHPFTHSCTHSHTDRPPVSHAGRPASRLRAVKVRRPVWPRLRDTWSPAYRPYGGVLSPSYSRTGLHRPGHTPAEGPGNARLNVWEETLRRSSDAASAGTDRRSTGAK